MNCVEYEESRNTFYMPSHTYAKKVFARVILYWNLQRFVKSKYWNTLVLSFSFKILDEEEHGELDCSERDLLNEYQSPGVVKP